MMDFWWEYPPNLNKYIFHLSQNTQPWAITQSSDWFERHAVPFSMQISKAQCHTSLIVRGRMRHIYTFSHFLSLPELSEKTQDRPTWRWSRCVSDVMSPVRRVSWETGMAWPVKPQWAGGVILQLKDRLRDSHMAHISKWQPVTGRRSTIRPCHLSPDWTRPTVFWRWGEAASLSN